jgi:F-box interacting protein
MDTEGTVVRVVEGPDGVWTFRASLGDLVCFSSGYNSSGIHVVDLATGKTILSCSESVAGVPMNYTCFGFGRAVQSGSLKVFRLVLPSSGGEQMCEVLTLGDGAKWRQTQSPPMTVSLWYSRCNGVMANGALHFLSWEDPDDVLSFDLDNEKWKVIHGPQGVVGDMEPIRITELNGTLCMAHIVEPVINIWLLSDLDQSIWIKAYTMPRDPVFCYVVPLRVLRLGGHLLFYYYNSSELKLRVYDPHLGKCTDMTTPPNLLGKIGLCSSNLDPRFCGQP